MHWIFTKYHIVSKKCSSLKALDIAEFLEWNKRNKVWRLGHCHLWDLFGIRVLKMHRIALWFLFNPRINLSPFTKDFRGEEHKWVYRLICLTPYLRGTHWKHQILLQPKPNCIFSHIIYALYSAILSLEFCYLVLCSFISQIVVMVLKTAYKSDTLTW